MCLALQSFSRFSIWKRQRHLPGAHVRYLCSRKCESRQFCFVFTLFIVCVFIFVLFLFHFYRLAVGCSQLSKLAALNIILNHIILTLKCRESPGINIHSPNPALINLPNVGEQQVSLATVPTFLSWCYQDLLGRISKHQYLLKKKKKSH